MSNTCTLANTMLSNISTTTGIDGTSYTIGTSIIPYTFTTSTGYSIGPNVAVNNELPSLEVKGKIVHNGRDLEERLKIIEEILCIPERDIKLENKYPKLKKMYEEYIKELSKLKIWESLKEEDL